MKAEADPWAEDLGWLAAHQEYLNPLGGNPISRMMTRLDAISAMRKIEESYG